jgi:hypothetical protein
MAIARLIQIHGLVLLHIAKPYDQEIVERVIGVGGPGLVGVEYPHPATQRTGEQSQSPISPVSGTACLEGSKLSTKTTSESAHSFTIMISTATKTASFTLKGTEESAMKIDGSATSFGDWRDDLARDGYVVIKGAIPRDRADQYADKMYSWLEGL